QREQAQVRIGPFAGLVESKGLLVSAAAVGPFQITFAAAEVVEVEPLFNSDHADFSEPAERGNVAPKGTRRAGDEDRHPELLGGPLHAAGEVDGVAERTVLELVTAARVADERLARVDADADADGDAGPVAPSCRQLRQLAEHGQSGPAR